MNPRFEARCAWCGPVELETGGLEIHVGPGPDGPGLAEFVCTHCGRLNLIRVGRMEAATLIAAGVRESERSAPFELLEERAGPPITWDDLIDFHQAIASSDVPPVLPRPHHIERTPEPNSGYERNAA